MEKELICGVCNMVFCSTGLLEKHKALFCNGSEACGRQLGHTERLKKMREMAAIHEHQLALIHAHSQQLKQQRDELALQVSVVEQSNITHLESLMMDLREQEERNEETLQQLAEHLHTLHVKEVPVPADQPAPRMNKKIHHDDNYELISSVDGTLSAQIKALQQAYMQSGGSHPAIVAQMTEMQAKAQSLKNQPATAAKARKKEK